MWLSKLSFLSQGSQFLGSVGHLLDGWIVKLATIKYQTYNMNPGMVVY